MTRYLKLLTSVLLCVLTLGLMGCNDYTPNPEDDIALFQPFIELTTSIRNPTTLISQVR